MLERVFRERSVAGSGSGSNPRDEVKAGRAFRLVSRRVIDVHQKPKQCFPLTLCNTPDEHDFDHDDVDKDDDVAMKTDEVGAAGDQSDVAVWI